MALTSEEVNYLVFRYLQESGDPATPYLPPPSSPSRDEPLQGSVARTLSRVLLGVETSRDISRWGLLTSSWNTASSPS